MNSPQSAFWRGARAVLPILFGTVPFGMIYGVSALAAGLTPAQAQAMSAIIFAGSAQFVLVQLVAAGAHPIVMVLTVFVVNLRHLLYGASIAPHLQPLSRGWKVLLGYLLVDETFAVAISRFEKGMPAPIKGALMAGVGLTLWLSWQASTAAGIFLGRQLPADIPLDFALPLTFIAIVVPMIRDRAAIAAAVVAGVTMVLAFNAPLKLGLLVATFAGMAAGLLLERGAKESA